MIYNVPNVKRRSDGNLIQCWIGSYSVLIRLIYFMLNIKYKENKTTVNLYNTRQLPMYIYMFSLSDKHDINCDYVHVSKHW